MRSLLKDKLHIDRKSGVDDFTHFECEVSFVKILWKFLEDNSSEIFGILYTDKRDTHSIFSFVKINGSLTTDKAPAYFVRKGKGFL